MIKAIIFDMDGLMIDSEKISYKCYKAILNKYGYSFTLDEYIKDYPGKPLMASLEFINEKYHLNYDVQEQLEYFHQLEYDFIENEGVQLKKGLLELLHYLKENNYQTIIASSSHQERAETLLKAHHISHYFDDTVYGKEVKRGKPFPDIFLKACEKLNIQTNEALVLEDSEAGIQAAYDAGIPVICIPDLKYPQQEYIDKTEAVLESLKDVISYIQKL